MDILNNSLKARLSNNIKKDDLFFLSQTLDEDENILSLHDKSNVTLNEYLLENLSM